MYRLLVIPLLFVLMFETACTPVEKQARDTVAALGGLLASAQAQNQQTCAVSQTQTICGVINKAIEAQNALVTATEAYCGWSTKTPPGDPNADCKPVKTAEGALQTAIANANTFITELKGVVK